MEQMNPQDYQKYLQESKLRVARELGIQLNVDGDNGHLTSRDAGRIGGILGGKIGGNMVKEMVRFAEEHLNASGSL
jgi:small acid-soluble spore protein D (minor alpha/beta-type SASP)